MSQFYLVLYKWNIGCCCSWLQLLDDYKNDTTYFGGLIRGVATQIEGANFELNGVKYKLSANNHENTFDGGQQRIRTEKFQENSHLTFTYNNFVGEQEFAGDIHVH